MASDNSKRTSLVAKLALLAGSTVVVLALAEIGARAYAHWHNQNTLERALKAPPDLAEGQPATLRSIIRMSEDDRIAYELRSGLEKVSYKGRPLTTNAMGFRSPDYPVEKPPHGVTIVGLGDSVMFGHGVGDGESYMDRLQELLVEERPDVDWRVINTGVPGYNTMMEVATLEQKVLPFGPDVVILGLVSNDFGPPNYVRVADDVWDPSRSFFLEFLRGQGAGSQDALKHRTRWVKETGGHQAPPRYAQLYGRKAFGAAVDRLKELSEQEGFEVIAFLMFETSVARDGKLTPEMEMVAACERRGFTIIRFQDVIERTLEATTDEPFSWELYEKSHLAASKNNSHPSAVLHNMAARRLFKHMKSSGLLEVLAPE
jgi:hypothetical protein